MCLKPNLKDNLQENFEKYEFVRQQGYFNMLDPRARQLTGLTKEQYKYIIKNYTRLLSQFPDTKEKVRVKLKGVTSLNNIQW